jgi:hypothetical protein
MGKVPFFYYFAKLQSDFTGGAPEILHACFPLCREAA